MKRTQQKGRPALDLIEEGTQRLRTAPVSTLAMYFLGGIPFVLGLLFFWTDMSRSPFASRHLGDGSFGMVILFLWMKFCHALFMRRMRAHISGGEIPPLGFRRGCRIFFTQAISQPTGLFILPLAAVPILPFAWVYAFYQNITALDEGEPTGTFALWKKAARQSALWSGQNQAIIGLMLVFSVCVFLNWLTVCMTIPELAKTLFGVQSDWGRSQEALRNSTFIAAMWSLTYLSVDPILKTVYTLRCFYGQSLQSGEDLKAELKPFTLSMRKLAAIIVISLAVFHPSVAGADGTNTMPTKLTVPAIASADLDQAINQTIHERKYVWRMPREQVVQPDDAQEGMIARFFDKIGDLLRDALKAVGNWISWLLHKLFDHRSTPKVEKSANSGSWIELLYFMYYVLIAVVVLALLFVIFRLWQEHQKKPKVVVTSVPIQPVPDVADENVRADQLPEDGWTKLARELLERGEFRLAMRAFYLAGLAHLAARNLVNIARFKSNRDYERELRRRAHAFPSLVTIFGDNLFTFERIWYGMHEVNGEVVGQFAANVEKMKAGG